MKRALVLALACHPAAPREPPPPIDDVYHGSFPLDGTVPIDDGNALAAELRAVVPYPLASCMANPGHTHECELWSGTTKAVVQLDARTAVDPQAWVGAARELATLPPGERGGASTTGPCRGRTLSNAKLTIEIEPYGAWDACPGLDGVSAALLACRHDVVQVDVMADGRVGMCNLYVDHDDEPHDSCACDAFHAGANLGSATGDGVRRLVLRYRQATRGF